MKTITAVPAFLTRKQYVDLMASVGFEPNDLRRLEFCMDGIYAEVIDRDERGSIIIDRERDEIAVNRVFIPIRDPETDG